MSIGRIVHKHKLPMGQCFRWAEIELTAEAKILAVGKDGNQDLVIWEEHSAYLKAKEIRNFLVVGTGVFFSAPDGRRMVHIGTAILPSYGTDYVWHVYEAKLY